MYQSGKGSISSAGAQSSVLSAAQAHVLRLFNQKHDARLLYHSYQHTTEVVNKVNDLARSGGFATTTAEIAMLAAWLHALGYLDDYTGYLPKSILMAEEFLQKQNFPESKMKKVLSCLNNLNPGIEPETLEEQLFIDGYHAQTATNTFFQQSPLLRLERELVLNVVLHPSEWAQVQLQSLLRTRFFTPYAKKVFEPILAQNILTQKEIVEKTKSNNRLPLDDEEQNLRIFQDLERKIPNRATQTFFRANYRNHINLSAIADNKANIMISVNAIIISVLISILSYQNITERNPLVLMPVVIFLVTGLTSLIFAVLSARPKVTSFLRPDSPMEKTRRNIVFFGNFVRLSLDQYEEAMDAMFRDGELIYGNMARDLYYLGKVLDKKYRFLTYSYNIFMVGFVATVLTFLIAFLS